MGHQGDSSRLHHLRDHRNLAGAVRRLPDRPLWPTPDGVRRRPADRRVLAAERLRGQPDDALYRRRGRRHRRRHHLRRHHRQRGQMVPGPAWPGVRPDGGGLWRRIGHHHRADFAVDCHQRLPVRLHYLRRGAGRRRGAGGAAANAAAESHPCGTGRQRPTIPPRRGAEASGVLADVRDVRHGRRRRADGHRPAGGDRAGLRGRQATRHHARPDPTGADLRAVAGPGAERADPTVLRLGVRPDRPRNHHVHRLRAGGVRHLRAGCLGA